MQLVDLLLLDLDNGLEFGLKVVDWCAWYDNMSIDWIITYFIIDGYYLMFDRALVTLNDLSFYLPCLFFLNVTSLISTLYFLFISMSFKRLFHNISRTLFLHISHSMLLFGMLLLFFFLSL